MEEEEEGEEEREGKEKLLGANGEVLCITSATLVRFRKSSWNSDLCNRQE